MSFLEHLTSSARIIYCLYALVAGCVVSFSFSIDRELHHGADHERVNTAAHQ
jgi:hypothetical protein